MITELLYSASFARILYNHEHIFYNVTKIYYSMATSFTTDTFVWSIITGKLIVTVSQLLANPQNS